MYYACPFTWGMTAGMRVFVVSYRVDVTYSSLNLLGTWRRSLYILNLLLSNQGGCLSDQTLIPYINIYKMLPIMKMDKRMLGLFQPKDFQYNYKGFYPAHLFSETLVGWKLSL